MSSTELAVHDGGQTPAPAPKHPLMAGASPKALVPVDFDGAYRIANVVHRAGMAPASLDTLEKVMVAILHGLEVGLTPMNALQSIAVINGRPTIWGDGAVGLIRASGLLEYMNEYYVDEDKPTMKAVCEVKRKGEPKSVTTDFSMADANKAGLLKKGGPWQTYPKRMLKMRARWALRDTFSDVLKGLSLREEVEDLVRSQESDTIEHQPQRRRVPSPPPEVTEPPVAEPVEEIDEYTGKVIGAKEEVEPDPVSSGKQEVAKTESDFPGDIPPALDRRPFDGKAWLAELEKAYVECADTEELSEAQKSVMFPAQDSASKADWAAAVKLTKQHLDRIQGAAEQ